MLLRRAVSALLLGVATSTVTLMVDAAAADVGLAIGKRCTIVGTSGADRLVGTAGRDLICGRGGKDTILGRGGGDVIYGGAGADRLVGGRGDDRLIGGKGRDAGSGYVGKDLLRGGDGNDVLSGGPSDDEVFGSGDNDDLDGGTGSDLVDGGQGTNWCIVDAADDAVRCRYDESAPGVGELRLSVDAVDVTAEDAFVRLAAHLTDDTGITRVQLIVQDQDTGNSAGSAWPTLRTGTVRDGWWVTTFRVPRWIEPGDYEVEAIVRDRVGRTTDHTWYDKTLTVRDDNPDRSAPEVTSLVAPPPGMIVDTRTRDARFVMRAHVTDTGSGVGDIVFCASHPLNGGYTNLGCLMPMLVSGTRHDGIWQAEMVIPQGAAGGDWNLEIWVEDRAHPGLTHFWMGPDAYRVRTSSGWPEPRDHELPDGAGRFQVLGVDDAHPPMLTSLVATPDQVDTLPRDASVEIRIHATDVEGIHSVGAYLRAQSGEVGAPDFYIDGFRLASGTPQNGEWVAHVTLPQGTPPGTYVFQAWVGDGRHWRSYVSASSPSAGQPNQEILTNDPVVVVVQH